MLCYYLLMRSLRSRESNRARISGSRGRSVENGTYTVSTGIVCTYTVQVVGANPPERKRRQQNHIHNGKQKETIDCSAPHIR